MEATVSIIVPVYNGSDYFNQCLASIAATDPPPEEVIVVADGESDGSWRIARNYPAMILNLDESGGPARARNHAGKKASGDILFFVDADVTLPGDAVRRVRTAFGRGSQIAAVFGSYDDSPAAENFLSQYKNLFHHYVHQTASEDAVTFWAGCGAVRRDVFLDIGGFDERYRAPSIEDIELGSRLKAGGWKIRLEKSLQAKHLKKWTVPSLLRADIFYRALPWTTLILDRKNLPNDLNLKMVNRLSAAGVLLFLGTLAGALLKPVLLMVAGVLGLALLGLNFNTYYFFYRRRGWFFTALVVPWHWFYYLYSSLAFVVGFIKHKLVGQGKRVDNAS